MIDDLGMAQRRDVDVLRRLAQRTVEDLLDGTKLDALVLSMARKLNQTINPTKNCVPRELPE
jgi:hypothetical protein